MTTSESEPPESEIAPPMILDSRKAKVVALFVAAPSAALLFYWLYHTARRLDLLPGPSLARSAPWYVESAHYLSIALAIGVIPLYIAFKIWIRPTLKNLRCVPFIAAVSCAFGVPVIFRLLPRFEWIPEELAPLVNVRNRLLLLLTLPAYFLVKKAMVLWFKTPELAQSGLQTYHRRGIWWLYCFFLWAFLGALGQDIESALGYNSPVQITTWKHDAVFLSMIIFPILTAVYVYKNGLRVLGLRPE